MLSSYCPRSRRHHRSSSRRRRNQQSRPCPQSSRPRRGRYHTATSLIWTSSSIDSLTLRGRSIGWTDTPGHSLGSKVLVVNSDGFGAIRGLVDSYETVGKFKHVVSERNDDAALSVGNPEIGERRTIELPGSWTECSWPQSRRS